MKIISPMAWGNGAYIVHRTIESHLKYYSVCSYNPYLTLFPPLLKGICKHEKKMDLIIHTAPDYAYFFKQTGVPLIVSFHNYVLDKDMQKYSSFFQRLHYQTDLKWWTRLSVKYARAITAVSHFTKNMIKEDLGVNQSIKIIYNGVDEKLFYPCHKRKTKTRLKIFFSGNMTFRKGSQWLQTISEKLNNESTIFFTRGLRKTRTTLSGRNLSAMGAVPFEQMPDRYKQMDILLMPTVREGFGLAVAEAMASGLPVVASNCSSIPELIDEGQGGYLCPVGDVDAFAEKLNILADSPRLRKEMGEYNRAKIEKMFTLDRMVNEYKMLFEEVMDNK